MQASSGQLEKGAFFKMLWRDCTCYHCAIMGDDGDSFSVLLVGVFGNPRTRLVKIRKAGFTADKRNFRCKLFDPACGLQVEVDEEPCTIDKYEVREEEGNLTMVAHVVDPRHKTGY